MKLTHTTTLVRPDDQIDTLIALDEIEVLFPNIEVVSQLVGNPDGYWQFLLQNWGTDNLINLEQDIVPRPGMIEDLLECPHVLCTFPYLLGEVVWSIWDGAWPSNAMRFFDKYGPLPVGTDIQPRSTWSYQPPFPAFATASALGLVKIHKSVQNDIPLSEYPIVNHDWSYLDTWISSYIATKLGGLRWHVHQPNVRHNHSR